MEILIVLAMLAALGCWLYRWGKRTGSRKGFGAGLKRGRRWFRRSRM